MCNYHVTVTARLPGILVVRVESPRKSHRHYTVEPLRDGMFDIREVWGAMNKIGKREFALREAIESAVRNVEQNA